MVPYLVTLDTKGIYTMSKNFKIVFGNENTVVVKNGLNPYTKCVEYDTLFWDNWVCVWSPVYREGSEVFDRSLKMAKRLYEDRITGIR